MTVLKNIIAICLISIPLISHGADKAPDFTVGVSKSGKKISLSSYKGRTIYLDFWASWCIPCKDSFPWMNKMQEQYKKNGLVVIAVNLDEDKNAAKHFLEKVPGNFTIVYNADGSIASQYGVEVMPTSFIIDKKGNLISRKLGFKLKNRSKMESDLKKALAIK